MRQFLNESIQKNGQIEEIHEVVIHEETDFSNEENVKMAMIPPTTPPSTQQDVAQVKISLNG